MISLKKSNLQRAKEKKTQRVEHDGNKIRKKAEACSHFNCKKFQKKVPHKKYSLTGKIARIFLL